MYDGPFDADSTSATIARAGDIDDIIVTSENTLNGTFHHGTEAHAANKFVADAAGSFPFEFVNRFKQSSGGQVKAYISGFDSEQKIVFIRADGSSFFPASRGSQIPVEVDNSQIAIDLPGSDQTLRVSIPSAIHSGRIYFSEGPLKFFMVKIPGGDGLVQPSVANPSDPNAETNWGFIEFTYNPDGSIWTNLSYVDFAGLLLGMSLSDRDDRVQAAEGLSVGAVSEICKGLAQQERQDGRRWSAMCVTNRAGVPVRVLSPNIYSTIRAADFEDYWQSYVDSVWRQYRRKTLSVAVSMAAAGAGARSAPHVEGAALIKCGVEDDSLMTCGASSFRYEKPTAQDIWGCDSGPFARRNSDDPVHLALIARLCAAFVRSTLLLNGGDLEPNRYTSNLYYTSNPTNHYSRLVHQHEVDGRGYAFPYDDVNVSGEDASGTLTSPRPKSLTVYFGGAAA
ncbi:glycoside hydrolase family 64 protein [Moelleriella libera RCEF 2490]|uniref:Glycoside hydrolase family 64 protein n=1 Tax=Moelleriella libera RCEF 2490 TaxID=1081109 RepID=A0A168BWA4_9HYPO|nr:glycoside hydrolase family 64 protein [Moelleriella libera RCEF 2490]